MPRILIVDDDVDLMVGLTAQLKADGFEVVQAMDAYGALSAARSERPDLILLDLGLPGGDGFSVMTRLAAIQPTAQIPIIVLSARDPVGNRRKARELGATRYFQKPARPEELHEAIREAVSVAV